MFPKCSKGPFRSFSVFLLFSVLYKLLGTFIDAEVSEMNEPFANIFGLDIILVCCESSKSLFEHIYSKWVIAGHYHIYSQVVLVVVYQMRV